jgi:membrane fusion protein, copper/silver efflux system
MKQKIVYLVLLLVALGVGFAVGHRHDAAHSAATRQVLYYVDPMHPAYRSSKPGKAPDCGMDLVPVYSEDLAKAVLPETASKTGGIHIDPASQQLYGIRVSKVQNSKGADSIRVFGRVMADETRVYKVNIGADGYVKETHDDAVGNLVKKDQHLALIYSPEFLTVTGGYLSANERTPGTTGKDNPSTPQNAASAQARADRLRNLGMSDVQINEVSSTRKIPEDIYVVSPTDGFILSRNISPGLRFERQTNFYTIGDLSHVWIIAEVFGADAGAFHPGAPVRVTLPETHQVFNARVSSQLPEIDPTSHTYKVRLDADNPGFKLRPDMFVDVELSRALPPGLSVPLDAVIDSGASRHVFVQTSEGNFVSREIRTGWRTEDRIQIVEGLREGDSVVSEGTFLVDSESRLQAGNGAPPGVSASGRDEIALATAHSEPHP